MANPRRRRTVVMGLTLAFVLVAQGPNLYFNVIRRAAHHSPHKESEGAQGQSATQTANNQEELKHLLAAQKFIPPLWVPFGAGDLAERRMGPA